MGWTWLLILLCPLMMLPMMYMMMKGGHGHDESLSKEVDALKKQNNTMKQELEELKTKV